jgi:hypothetical protein
MMKIFFFRRRHQKLDEIIDEPLDLTHRQSDVSSGSESFNSFDPHPGRYAHETFSHSPVMMELNNRSKSEFSPADVSENASSRRRWTLQWPSKKSSQKMLLKNIVPSDELFNQRGNRSTALADLDNTAMPLRGKSSSGENPPTRQVSIKVGSNAWTNDDPTGASAVSRQLSREVTWRRRVSSLEAFFKKETTSKSSRESVIKKCIPFDTEIGNPSTSLLSGGTDDGPRGVMPRVVGKKSRERKTSLEETVEQSVSNIIGEITSRGEEILESVPDWSVGSSSGDFYTSATSDDEDTSFSEIHGHPRYSWSLVERSLSSVDDDDDDDFTTEAGCHSVQSCDMMTTEISTLLQEMLPRDSSALRCLVPISGDHRRSGK